MDLKPLPNYSVSYSVLLIIVFIFSILMASLAKTHPNSFDKSFGYQLIFTGPMLLLFIFLIMEFVYYKQNPYESALYTLFTTINITLDPNIFGKVILFLIVAVGLSTFFTLLYMGGVFSDNPPENNVTTIMNFILISTFIIVGVFVYKHYQNKDALKLRTKYTAIFAIFMTSMFVLYFLNPFGIMTDYGGPVMFFTLCFGMFFMIIITMYNKYLDVPTKNIQADDWIAHFFSQSQYIVIFIILAILVLFGFFSLTGIFNFDETSTKSWTSVIFNFMVLFVVLGIIYKFLNLGGTINDMIESSATLRFIINVFFYIPCLFLYVVYYIFGLLPKDATGKGFSFNFKQFTSTPTKPFEMLMLGLSLVLLGGYFTWTMFAHKYFSRQYLKQGGKVLVNEPVPTNKLTNVTSYQELSGKDTFDYQYALSFWYYLDAFPPSTNASYNKVVSLLSYGGNPSINYSSNDNSLYITVKDTESGEENVSQSMDMTIENLMEYIQNSNNKVVQSAKNAIENVKALSFGKEMDSDGNIIIYKHPNVQLQKWNHVLLNYSGGTLDIFYNGKLVKTAIEVVPYMKNDMLTIGTEKGISGNIANLSYFDKPLDIKTIDTLYVELKDKNSPSIPSAGKDDAI